MSIRTQRSSSRFGAATIVAALIAALFAFATPAGAVQNVTVERTSGPDRYATAAAIALEDFPTGERPVSHVVLVSGENFPDGLAAASLAGALNAPVLLTATNSLPASTASALASLAPETVHIVGGTAAVSAGVRGTLTSLGYTLNEISGANRYETAVEVSAYQRTSVTPVGNFGGQRTAIIATGDNWPDALAAGAPAAHGRHPILLVSNTLPAETAAELTAAGVQQVLILGGTAAVSASVADAIEALGIDVTRISGADRYATAAELAELAFTPSPVGFTFRDTHVFLVSGSTFADALSAGPWAARERSAMVLAGGQATLDFLTANNNTISDIRVIGGTAAVSDAEAQAAKEAAEPATPSAQIAAWPGATGIQVTFGEAVTNSGVISVTGSGPAAGTSVTCPAGTDCEFLPGSDDKVLIVDLDSAALTAGDIITVSGFQTPGANPRTIAPSTYVVPRAAAATGTITAVQNTNQFSLTFNRSVSTPGTIEVLRDGAVVGTVAPGTATDAPYNSRFRPTFSGAGELQVNDIIRVTGAVSGGETVPTFQRTVVGDHIRPNLNASLLTVTGTRGGASTATGSLDSVALVAKNIGPESQFIEVVVDTQDTVSTPLAIEVTQPYEDDPDPNVARVTRITVLRGTNADGDPTGSTPAQVAAAINGHAVAGDLVTATGNPLTTDQVTETTAPVPLTPGSRSAAVTLLYNEALRNPTNGTGAPFTHPVSGAYLGEVFVDAGAPAGPVSPISFALDLDGNGSVESGLGGPTLIFSGKNAAGTTSTNLATGQLTVVFTLGVDQHASAGTTQIRTEGVQDLAGNRAAFVASTLAAVPGS